jgi:hypothetical protein
MLRNSLITAATLMVIARTGMAQSLTPLPTPDERRAAYWKGLANPLSVVTSAASAGIGQWRDAPEEWEQGGSGFAKRFVSSYGGHMVHSTLEFGASSLLNEDTRYIPSGRKGFGPRLKYALANSMTARYRGDDGIMYSRISGAKLSALVGTAAVSRIWQPDRSVSTFATACATSLGISIGFTVAREFLPSSLRRK